MPPDKVLYHLNVYVGLVVDAFNATEISPII